MLEDRRSAADHRWRLPAVLRYLIAVVLGAAVAALATYLVRSIGF